MKKYFVGLSILAVAVFAAAFTAPKAVNKKLLSNWYEYRGPLPGTNSDLKEESNYFLVSSDPQCSSDQVICAIQVQGTGQHPDSFSTTTENDIVSAVSSNTPVAGYIEMDSQ